MTQDEFIEMARQAGLHATLYFRKEQLREFAKLVEERTAAKEREACAKLAFQYGYGLDDDDAQMAAVEISDAIRARGEA